MSISLLYNTKLKIKLCSQLKKRLPFKLKQTEVHLTLLQNHYIINSVFCWLAKSTCHISSKN